MFDYAAFKREWRRLAAERGIDPVEGATSYQVALVKAEPGRVGRLPLDWSRYEASLHDGAEGARDAVEVEAWTRLNDYANRRQHGDMVLVDVVTLREIYPDAAREFVGARVGGRLARLRRGTVQFGLGLELA